MKQFYALCVSLILFTPIHASDFEIIDREGDAAPIIVARDAPPRTRDAAVTLADYIEKISGVRPELIDGSPDPVPARTIWVGVQTPSAKLFPDHDLTFQHPEEILILSNENHLVIGGRDRWNPKHTTVKGRLSVETDVQQEYGTANAVYTFIRDQLGVRWLWPDEEDFEKSDRLSVSPVEFRYHPQFRARHGMFQKLSLGDNKEGADELWARFHRVQLDSMDLIGGHGFGHWWDTYHEDHPGYFALYPDGTRKRNKFNSRTTKLCDSNPEVWDQWLKEVEEAITENPLKFIFSVSPNDGYNSGHCLCENCKAWDHPEGEEFQWSYGDGIFVDGVALSDRQVTFANTLARMLKKRYPDKDYYVMLHAYGYSRPAPVEAVPDSNVIISSVSSFAMRSPEARELAMAQHAGWAKVAPQLMWRPNLGNQVGHAWGLPDVPISQAGEDFRFVSDHNGIGLLFDVFWFHWATQGPYYYALAHLAWDPYTDVDALMDDYYKRAFGPAAADLKAYWKLLEKTRMEFVAEHLSRQRVFDAPGKYTEEVFARANDHLTSAAKKLNGADEKYQRRLAFVKDGFEYTKLLIDTRFWMQQFEDSEFKNEEAKNRVLANWTEAESMKETFPPFAINWVVGFRAKESKRSVGLHPDFPLSGRVLRELRAVGLE